MPDESRSFDPDAIRDVANNDLSEVSTHLEDSRAAFNALQDFISTATQSSDSGFDPLSSIGTKLFETAKAIYTGSIDAQSNLENTIEGLKKAADQYELDDSATADNINSLDDEY